MDSEPPDNPVTQNVRPPLAKRFSWAKSGLQLALSAAILLFLGHYLYTSWRGAAEYHWHFRPVPLALSFVILLTGQSLLGVCWHLIFAVLGTKVRLRASCRGLLVGQLAKYVPGKVLTLVVRVHLMKQAGAREETTMVAQVLEAATLCISGLLVAVLCSLGAPALLAHKGFHALFLVIPVALVAMHPAVLRRPVEFAARKLRRPRMELRASYAGLLGVTISYGSVWLAFGIGLYFLAAAVSTVGGSVWHYTGAYALSWVAGFVTFLTPAGLGVREAALAALLGPEVGAAPAVALALLARVWVTIGEIICAAAVSNFRIASFIPPTNKDDGPVTDGD